MQRPRRKANITTGKIPPPVGFQIMPASGGGSSNAPSMRPTYSFLPVDQSDINKRLAADQTTWRANNPDAQACRYPGLDLYGQGQGIGARHCESEFNCSNGQIYVEKNNRCECPSGWAWNDWAGKCTSTAEGGTGRPGNPFAV